MPGASYYALTYLSGVMVTAFAMKGAE